MDIMNNKPADVEKEMSSSPAKVFLWALPRSLSTVFLKCMAHTPDTIAWYEPFHQLSRFGPDKDPLLAEPFDKLLDKLGGKAAVDEITAGFDSKGATFDWLKTSLEGDFPGKKLVIVKAQSSMIPWFDRFDKIPSGFRHTFLIRHPIKVAKSLMQVKNKNKNIVNTQDVLIGKAFPCKSSYEILQYVKKHFPDLSPVIIDADDLLANPAGMIETYCNAVNIPYSDDLLQWEPGNDMETNPNWKLPKETILVCRAHPGVHDTVMASSGFKKPSGAPLPGIDDISEHMAKLVAAEMPYYEKLYAERLQCENNNIVK